LPHLIDLYRKHHAEGLEVVGITIENAEIARAFAKEQSVPYPILIDPGSKVSAQFDAESIPKTYVLDRQGRAAGIAPGYRDEWMDQIEKLVGQLLKEP
jgi:peroxiredoxin